MRDQGHGVRRPLVWHEMANTGRYALVPPVAVGILLPIGLLLVQRSGIAQLTMVYVDYATRLMAPALAAWWPSFVFKERIEGDGKELLFFLRRKGAGTRAVFLAVLYWLLLIPFELVALGTPYVSLSSLTLVLARCLFMAAFGFFAAFALQSGVIALILATAVNLMGMAPMEAAIDTSGMARFGVAGGLGVDTATVLYVLLSAALFWLGELMSRRFTS